MNTIFILRRNTTLLIFECQNPKIKKSGLNSITYGAVQVRKNVPEEVRNSVSHFILNESINKAPLISCWCNCCKKYNRSYHISSYT